MVYLEAIKNWMLDHPSEILVMWISKHGNTGHKGNDQYPNVTIATK